MGDDPCRRHNTLAPSEQRGLAPETVAALGLGRWPWPIVAGTTYLLTTCPRCELGVIALLPPTGPGERPLLACVVSCLGRGLRCPPPAVREAARAVMCGDPVPVDEGDARRLGALLARLLPDLWSGRSGQDPRRALWAALFALEELGLPDRLVELGVRALAVKRRWSDALAEGVLGRRAAA